MANEQLTIGQDKARLSELGKTARYEFRAGWP